MLTRPHPPEDLAGFRPAPDVEAWARATFIDDGATLLNEEHAHLVDARIGFVWTDVANGSGAHVVVGQAEIPSVQGGKWARGRFFQQLEEWFGEVPDFLITLHADSARLADDATWCAVVEHELYHCGQAVDAFGAPKFRNDGSPAFCIRKHDVEEFVGVVARYGAGSAAGQTRALVEAANAPPLIAAAQIAGCCGTCGRGV